MKCAWPLAVMVLTLSAGLAFAKNAGDSLEQYLDKPGEFANEELAYVEVVNVNVDAKPLDGFMQTGIVEFRCIESVGGKVPASVKVHFYLRDYQKDAWTWDTVELGKGKRLLGFFNDWGNTGKWDIRKYGRTNVVANIENIDARQLARAQKLFEAGLTAGTAVR